MFTGILGVTVAGTLAATASAQDPLAAIRGALGWDSARGVAAVRVEARVTQPEAPARVLLVATPDGRLLRRLDGPLPTLEWLDGNRGIATDWGGVPRPLRGAERDIAQLVTAFITGTWLAPDAAVGPDPTEGSGLRLRVRAGTQTASLQLDSAMGGRPVAVEFETLRGPERLELSFGHGSAPWVPSRVRHTVGGVELLSYEVLTVTHGDAFALGLVEPSLTFPRDARFDPTNPSVRTERGSTGHLLVETTVNGVTGWFILDTGASTTVVQSKGAVATAPVLGFTPLTSVWGVQQAPVRRADSVRVGPVVIRGLPLIETDLGFLSEPLGRPILGIIGYDLFSRTVADIDPMTPSVGLSPDGRGLGSVPWTPLDLEAKLPVIRGRWEGGHEGSFRLDLGAGPAVIFHWPTVERLAMLEGRTGQRVPAGADTLVMGRVAWFELAGVRHEKVVAFFPDHPTSGPLRDRHTTGNLGLGLLDKFRIVLDYRRHRLALIPRAP